MTFRTWVRGALVAGLVAGVLDLFAAMITHKVPMATVMKSIASGVLGRSAFEGGPAVAALGTGLHLFIAVSAATVYAAAAHAVPPLARRPFLFGPLFGLGVYMVMNYLVVPLSASPLKPPAGEMIVKGVLVHMLAFGLPIALIVSRSLRAAKSPQPGDRARS